MWKINWKMVKSEFNYQYRLVKTTKIPEGDIYTKAQKWQAGEVLFRSCPDLSGGFRGK